MESALGLIGSLALGLSVGAAVVQIFGRGKKDDAMVVTKDICLVKHTEMDRHMTSLKDSMSAGFERLDHSIERLYDKLEQQTPAAPLGQSVRRKGTS